MKYPAPIISLIDGFERYPGIGHKSAERLAFYTLNKITDEDAKTFAKAILDAKSQIKYCQRCGNITTEDLCDICTDESRNKTQIMVVEEIKDLLAVEKIGEYKGVYHVLGGVINYQAGIGPKDLNIEPLLEKSKDSVEIIIATNATVNGEMTAKYLKALLKDVKVTRIAYGLPVGSDLEYADQMTLLKALEGRKDY